MPKSKRHPKRRKLLKSRKTNTAVAVLDPVAIQHYLAAAKGNLISGGP